MEKIKQIVVVGGSSGILATENLLRAFNVMFSRQNLVSSVLAVKSAASPLARVTGNVTAMLNGRLVQSVAADLPAVTLVLTAAQTAYGLVLMDAAGVFTVNYSAPAVGVGNIQFPLVPTDKVALGFILFNTAATFTGGTTAMDTAGISYFNTVGAFSPTNVF